MTAPATEKVEGNKATMCFYLPKKFQENYPEPQDENVFILSKPTMKIFKLLVKPLNVFIHIYIFGYITTLLKTQRLSYKIKSSSNFYLEVQMLFKLV